MKIERYSEREKTYPGELLPQSKKTRVMCLGRFLKMYNLSFLLSHQFFVQNQLLSMFTSFRSIVNERRCTELNILLL